MQVKEFMTEEVKTCHRGTNLAKAASAMWEGDCGVLPVVDDNGKVTGMISDRDICIAVVTKGRLASEIAVGEVTAGMGLYTCSPSQPIIEALEIMKEHKVRRLPVVDESGMLCGILSLSDIVQKVGSRRSSRVAVTAAEVIDTIKAISAPANAERHLSQTAQA